jgi:protein-S-isoprenylcysteine O-methyltransferase Ste14
MMVRLVVQSSVWMVFLAAVLFVPAGTLAWPGGWIFLAELGGLGMVIGLWLARHDPDLLRQRMGSFVQREQQSWDKAFAVTFLALWHIWLVVMALDAVRFGWSTVPVWLQAVGALGVALCMGLTALTFRANSYAVPVVRVQRERGQHVVSTGPYAYVRHPMYSGAVCLFVGTPLLLGSWIGLAMAVLLVMLLAVRAVLEEKTLADELEGYRDYAQRVRYRFVPLVW